MKTSQLLVFCAVVEQGGFNRAAKFLFITQPAVSLRIRELERVFGQPLFDHKQTPVQLTPLGQEVYQLAREIREKFEELYQIRDRIHSGGNQSLVLSFSNTIEAHLITPKLLAFQSLHPNIRVVLERLDSSEIISALLTQQSDFGLMLEPVLDEQLVTVAKWPDALIVVQTADEHSSPITEQSSFILPPQHSDVLRRLIDHIFLRTYGHPPASYMEIGDIEGIKQAITATRHPAIVLEKSVTRELESGTFNPVSLDGFPYLCSHILCGRQSYRDNAHFQALTHFFQQPIES